MEWTITVFVKEKKIQRTHIDRSFRDYQSNICNSILSFWCGWGVIETLRFVIILSTICGLGWTSMQYFYKESNISSCCHFLKFNHRQPHTYWQFFFVMVSIKYKLFANQPLARWTRNEKKTHAHTSTMRSINEKCGMRCSLKSYKKKWKKLVRCDCNWSFIASHIKVAFHWNMKLFFLATEVNKKIETQW